MKKSTKKQIKQALFNYLYEDHGILMMDSDFNEIVHIIKKASKNELTREIKKRNKILKDVAQ